MDNNIFNKKYGFKGLKNASFHANGLPEDLELLRSEFVPCISFKHFALNWRKLRFASIFGLRYTVSEITEFVEIALHYCKGYLFAKDKASNVFGIYLMYAIHDRQPVLNFRVKPRLILSELEQLKDIYIQFGNDPKYGDARYIIARCFKEGIFQIVAANFDAGIENGFRKYFGSVNDLDNESTSIAKSFNKDLINEFEKISTIYTQRKKTVFGDVEAFSSETNFLDKMNYYLKELTKTQHVGEIKVEAMEIEDETEVKPSCSSDIGERRAALKKKSFKSHNT